MEDTIEDIQQLKKALEIVYTSSSEEEYIQKVKRTLFEEDCSHQCYYRDE